MNNKTPLLRRANACFGFITPGTLLVATLSTLALVAGCHSALPFATATAAAPGVSTAAARPSGESTMPALQPFDEQFFVATTDDTDTAQN